MIVYIHMYMDWNGSVHFVHCTMVYTYFDIIQMAKPRAGKHFAMFMGGFHLFMGKVLHVCH